MSATLVLALKVVAAMFAIWCGRQTANRTGRTWLGVVVFLIVFAIGALIFSALGWSDVTMAGLLTA